MSLVRRMVALRSCRAPPAARGPARAAWARRWWSVLSTAVQQAHVLFPGQRRVGCQPWTRFWHPHLPTPSIGSRSADWPALKRDRAIGNDHGSEKRSAKKKKKKKTDRRPPSPYSPMPAKVLAFQAPDPRPRPLQSLVACLRGARRGSAAGPSGMTQEHVPSL